MTRIVSVALVSTLLSGTAFAQSAEPPVAPVPAETSSLKISMFADAYYGYNSQKNGGTNQFGGTHAGHRAYARNNGFSLSFLGTDIVYDTEHFGATASLRFGPSVNIFYGRDPATGEGVAAPFGIENILQAYGTWKPTGKLSIDFGQFGTIYGAEVAESWKNLNYTRGGLYFAMQPFWHTGMRAKLAVTDEVTLTGMVVNGVNNAIDNGKARPSLGFQVAYAAEGVGAVLGYLGSLDPATDPLFDHFVDLVITGAAGPVNLVFNGDFGMDTKRTATLADVTVATDDAMFYGVSLAGGVSLTQMLGVALRGEYLADPDGAILGAIDGNLITGTGTIDFRPDPSGKLIIRWDNRVEKGNNNFFVNRDVAADAAANTDVWYTSVLGFVVTSD